MILKLTPQAARLLAIQDATRAMRDTDFDGASFECCEAFDDYRFAGLGDAILCDPGIEIEAAVVEVYDVAYRDAWDRMQRLSPVGLGPRGLRIRTSRQLS